MIFDGPTAPPWLPPEIYSDRGLNEKFSIECDLGKGGSGVVVGARHRELDQRVAIKFLWPGPLSSEALARFRGEARAASRIKNEHVVRIIDVSTTEVGIPFIVMEYLEGVDLERMLQQSPNRQVPVPDAIDFILQACQALVECHAQGIIHRDLKPSNLFCLQGDDGVPMIKVLDFGISKLGMVSNDSTVTDPCRILGSPSYMSPEQFDSPADVDLRTDIWALGVILYELVTGVSPFFETSVLKVWQKVRSEQPTPLETLRPDAPAELTAVVMKCLAKNREERHANVIELANALEPFAPPGARTSLARLLRVSDARGRARRAEDTPRHEAISEAPTIHSLLPGRAKSRTRWGPALFLVGTAVALLWSTRSYRWLAPSTDGDGAARMPPVAVAHASETPPPLSTVAAAPSSYLQSSVPIAPPATANEPTPTSTTSTRTSGRPRPAGSAPLAPLSAAASPSAAPSQNVPVANKSDDVAPKTEPSAPPSASVTRTSPMIVDILETRKPVR
jgi:serine/threonine-protein kinase